MNYLFLCKVIQILLAIFIVILTLIQSKGKGLSSGLKGSFSMYRSLRGFEKFIFTLTIILGVILVANSLVIVLLS